MKEVYGLFRGLPEMITIPFWGQFIDDHGDTQCFYIESSGYFFESITLKEDDKSFVKIAPEELVKW